MADQTISPDVMDVLQRSTITENSVVLPAGQLARPLYEAVNKVLINAGGAWSKKQKAHLFPGDPRPKLGLAMETGVSVDEKKKFQAFYTPADLAKRVIELAQIGECHTVLEPSCGEGALLHALLENADGVGAITAVELNPEAAAVSGELLATSRVEQNLYVEDFMKIHLRQEFDRIVMNPPFTKNQDLKHVEKALTLLVDGGILVAIMAPTQHRHGFQEILRKYSCDVEEVPAGTFKESGTNIATIILIVRK